MGQGSEDGVAVPGYDVVALAASAGGIRALSRVLAELPADFPAPILVALHRAATLPDLLPAVLGRAARLRVKAALAGEVPRPGVAYTAPPGRHLEVGRYGQLVVSRAGRRRWC